MNVAQLREALAELPDWYEVQVVVDTDAAWATDVSLAVPDGGTQPRVVIR